MKFFNSLISDIEKLLTPLNYHKLNPSTPWRDFGQNQIILKRDTAFELDGVGFNLVTSQNIPDSIILVGDDLKDIRFNRKFARIALVQIDESEDAQAEYNLIKKIDYVKYHLFPDGYMMRSTSRSHQEAVRVSLSAIKNGINFQSIGSLMIEKYKQIPAVKSVTIIFITSPEANYTEIANIAEKNHSITETLNHVMNQMTFDCDTCKQKAICDEIEGIKNLHFAKMNT